VLQHGNTLHGLQFVNPALAVRPTVYYDEMSGVGRALLSLPQRGRRIGLVGLGIGTLAAYGRTNDYYRFYEINSMVMRMAMKYFTYAPHCLAKADCVIADARLSLEKEPPQNFDLLVLDAFSGDSVPAHLLTKEAFAVYDRHLNTNGIIAVHASNVYLDLEPLLVNLAHELGYGVAVVESRPAPGQWWVWSSNWILLSRNAEALAAPVIREATRAPESNRKKVRVWTDDFTSLFQVLRRRQ
jgi:spermidine synthase